MKKIIAALGLSAILLSSAPSRAYIMEEEDPFLKAPFPPASIFAVLLEVEGQCRIALLRNGARDVLFPGETDIEISNLFYLILDTEAHLKNGERLPVNFYFPNSQFRASVTASEIVPATCAQLSHLEVLTARCRLQGYDLGEDRFFDLTREVCVPGLPRRLDFFFEMNEDATLDWYDK